MKEFIKDNTLEEIFSLDYFNETLTQKGIVYTMLSSVEELPRRKKKNQRLKRIYQY
jgi:hypothetical protein